MAKDNSGKAGDDVPDELPPLAEDNKPTLSFLKSTDSKKDVPDELPSLSPNISPETAKQEAKYPSAPPKERQTIEREIEMIHRELSRPVEIQVVQAETADINPSVQSQIRDAAQQAPTAAPEDMHFSMPSMAMKLQEEETKPGFFSDLIRVVKEQGFNDSLVSQDLFRRMKGYWEMRGTETPGVFTAEEKDLQNSLIGRLDELRGLEAKWQVQKKILEEDTKYLMQRENEIKKRADDIKRIAKELKFHQNVSQQEYFVLNNKVVIKNVKEMIDVLKVVDDQTFYHHVNAHKNDFAEWIRHAVHDLRLAEIINPIRERNMIIAEMEKEIKAEEEDSRPVSYYFKTEDLEIENKPKNYIDASHEKTQLHPPIEAGKHAPINLELSGTHSKQVEAHHHFRLADGQTIKSLKDLPAALRQMDDNTFYHHVNANKNDFAEWIKNVFSDEKLANHLLPIKNRKEMIDFLDIFL